MHQHKFGDSGHYLEIDSQTSLFFIIHSWQFLYSKATENAWEKCHSDFDN